MNNLAHIATHASVYADILVIEGSGTLTHEPEGYVVNAGDFPLVFAEFGEALDYLCEIRGFYDQHN